MPDIKFPKEFTVTLHNRVEYHLKDILPDAVHTRCESYKLHSNEFKNLKTYINEQKRPIIVSSDGFHYQGFVTQAMASVRSS